MTQPRYGSPAATGRKWQDAAVASGGVAAVGGLTAATGSAMRAGVTTQGIDRARMAQKKAIAHRNKVTGRNVPVEIARSKGTLRPANVEPKTLAGAKVVSDDAFERFNLIHQTGGMTTDELKEKMKPYNRTTASYRGKARGAGRGVRAAPENIRREVQRYADALGRGTKVKRAGVKIATVGGLAALGSMAMGERARSRAGRKGKPEPAAPQRDYRAHESSGGLLRDAEGNKREAPSGRDWLRANEGRP